MAVVGPRAPAWDAELAEVSVVHPGLGDWDGARVIRAAVAGEAVDFHFLCELVDLPQGTGGALYRSGRGAAFVTDTGTFWAI